jgi:hypothetical protein
MTDGYDCYQNALAERVNGILKNGFFLSRPADLAQAREMVKESVAVYNHERPHQALKYKTPDDVHQAFYRQKTVNLYQDQSYCTPGGMKSPDRGSTTGDSQVDRLSAQRTACPQGERSESIPPHSHITSACY